MKKIIFIVSFALFSVSGFSQNSLTWFSLSARGGFGTSMLINVPSLDDSNIDYEYYSPSYFFGGRFGLMFGDYIGISGIVATNSLSQNYNIHGATELHRFMHLNTFDYGLLLNLETPTGFYFEIGPKFSNLKSAQLTNTGDNINSSYDRIMNFSPEYTSLMFGIGMKALMTDKFEIKTGLNGSYSFSSIVSKTGYIIPADDNSIYTPSYSDETTNPAQLIFTVELTYVFGRFGKASCGKYQFLFN